MRMQPGQQRPHVRLGPRDPDEHVEAEAEHEPRHQRPAEAHSQSPAQQEGPEGGGEHLQRGDHPERPPEGQQVGGEAEGGEHGRLGVGQVRPPGADGRVPERGARQLGPVVLQPGLELHGRVHQLVVRAEGADVVRALGRPRGGGPEVVRRRQRVPGEQGGGVEENGQHGVQQRRRGHGAGADEASPARPSGLATQGRGVVPVPVDRSPQALLQVDRGAQPVSSRSFVASTYWRSISPVRRARALDVGLDVGAREPADRSTTSRTVCGASAAGVERLAARAAVAVRARRRSRGRPPPRPRRRGSRARASRRSGSPGARPASTAATASGTRRDAVEVAAAVDVGEARDARPARRRCASRSARSGPSRPC